ncbi:MAG: indole-3-glycerol phosphate synthase TrpC [Candidatus Latescibacteria bacterium]|nr:indole-3-glycerol phosphate synthase TrpC [Candidatus Latescibacterota bacterium]
MADILSEIAAYKREFVADRKRERSLADVRSQARDTPVPTDFMGALAADGTALIAEIKKASPSKGVIRADFDPEWIADAYAANGARCLSVLTDEAYFQGCDDYVQMAKAVAGLPVLRKDFTIDEYQLYEARVIGADAILLIVALMDSSQLDDYLGLATELELDALVEVHDREELARAKAAGARLIGVNNRDLRTFETALDTTFALVNQMPEGAVVVSESGIGDRGDVERLEAAGVNAILVGESLMREDDIGAKVRELLGE